jgi:ATP-dependent Clp protease ATP-binding subunit ClpA
MGILGYRSAIAYGHAVLDRYDDEAGRVVSAAAEEARRLGHGHVGTEHLLLGLLRQRGSRAAEALDASGVFLEPCRQKVSEALASRMTAPAASAGSPLPFTDRASRALDRASRLSLRMGSNVVRSDHVLVSVLDVEGTAGQVLRGLSVDPALVRDALIAEAALSPALSRDQTPAEVFPGAGDSQLAASKRFAEPICRGCGAALRGSLDQVELPVGSVQQGPVPGVTVVFCTGCGSAIGVMSAGRL